MGKLRDAVVNLPMRPHIKYSTRRFATSARGRAAGAATTMLDRPPSSQRKGTAKLGETVAEVSSAGASGTDEHPAGVQGFDRMSNCVLHVIDQLYGHGCALALCALFLALGVCCFTIGVFALAMNQFFLGRMLKAAQAC